MFVLFMVSLWCIIDASEAFNVSHKEISMATPIKWTDEALLEASKKYGSVKEFRVGNNPAYVSAYRSGRLAMACAHMSVSRQTWTMDSLRSEAKKFTRRVDFENGSLSAYQFARRRKILDEICGHMDKPPQEWTEQAIFEEARNYTSRLDFQKNSKAYAAALRRGMLDDVCRHMPKKHKSWTNEELESIARKYPHRGDFSKQHPVAYTTALRRGILDKICWHMKSRKWGGGFKSDMPAVLYLVKFDSECLDAPVFKVGITNHTAEVRANRCGSWLLDQSVTMSVVKEISFERGKDAARLEAHILRSLKEHRYTGRRFLSSGWTEVLTIDPMSTDAWKKIPAQ
jgi:hypothetical protein